MNEIDMQIKKLFEDIPESNRKNEIIQEITQNLNEKVSDLVLNGRTREQAIKQAVDDFGDIDDLKKEFIDSTRVAESKRNGLSLAFSIWGGSLILALFLFINFYYTPNTIWFVYPAFAVVWWPMTMYFQWYRNKYDVPIGFAFSVCSFVLIIGLMLFINIYYTPKILWFVYPIFAIIWWPLAMFFHNLRQKTREEVE
jgi:4-hydroxybenzoate polyprenyltransferase